MGSTHSSNLVNLSEFREKLAAEKEYNKSVSPYKLLQIVAPFLLHLAKQPGDSLRTQTIHYIMEEWYVKRPKYDNHYLSEYPLGSFTSYCFHCFSKLDRCDSYMPIRCIHCKAYPDLQLYFFQDLLHYRYKIHPVWIEKIFCEYLLNRSETHFEHTNGHRAP